MAITITIANQKGGIGKTTTVINISDALANIAGYKVLTLDMDPQCNTTAVFGAKIDGEYTMHDVLMDKNVEPEQAVQKTELGDIIAGDHLLARDQSELMFQTAGYNCLKKRVIEKMNNKYDFIIIDTPPTLGLLMTSALVCATGLIIPLQPERFSVDGLAQLIETVNEVIDNTNPDLEIYGTLITEYDQRNKFDREMGQDLPQKVHSLGMKCFSTPIRKCQEIRKATSMGISLYKLAPKCNAAIDYIMVAKELLEVIQNG